MKVKLTEKQKLWYNIFSCAVKRSNYYFEQKDLDRQAREHTTVVLAIQLGGKFWLDML